LLARITYGLVGLALLTLILGFFQKSSNALLYVSIVLSVIAIVLVLVGAARRARELPSGAGSPEPGYEPAFEDTQITALEDELPEGLLSAFDEEEEEEEEPGEVLPRRRPAAAKPAAKPAAKSSAAKSRARASTATKAASSKVIVVPGRDRYHASSCRFIQGKDDVEEVTPATAKRRGYQPCSACKPG
jgi:hypothetical protein